MFTYEKIMKNVLKLIVLVVVTFTVVYFIKMDKNVDTDINGGKLKESKVTLNLNEKIKKDNVIFNPTFQFLWDDLKNSTREGKIILNDDSDYLNFLNTNIIDKNIIDDKYYIAMSGYEKDNIINKIKQKLTYKFDNYKGVSNTLKGPKDLILYSYLKRNIKFNNTFEKLTFPIEFESQDKITRVKGFGINKYEDEEQNKIANQVSILDYKNMEDFIIKLNPLNKEDEIIMAKIPKEETLLKTINKVEKRIEENTSSKMKLGETLAIPNIQFDIQTDYKSLIDKKILNRGFEYNFIVNATTNTDLKIESNGLIIKKKTNNFLLKNSYKKRWFIFDKPFLVYIKRKGSNTPYIAMWMDNSELLKKYYN
ncbi:hypothetical protein GCM10008906_33110 [Clostridium oceanicum]|uniref:DUF4825 domain-containing protein n=2 Tax=Clostridium oceanicum TaxID=1543 RepID=A0ABP3V1V8_9CLOT